MCEEDNRRVPGSLENKATELEVEVVVEDSRRGYLSRVVLDSQSETAHATLLIWYMILPGGYAQRPYRT